MVSDNTRNKGMNALNGVTTLPSTYFYRESQVPRTKFLRFTSISI